VEFDHKIIDLKDKPSEFVAKYREASGGYGSGLVPLLEHENNLVIESDVVTKYIAKNIDGVTGKGDFLYPENEEDKKHVELFLCKWQDLVDTYYELLTASSQKEVDEIEPSFKENFGAIEDLLQKRPGHFLLGEKFSYAECITAPWIQRFYVTLPYFRGIDLDKDVLKRFHSLPTWAKAVCNRPSCIASKCPETEMIAACKRYYVSFVSSGAKGHL